MAQNKIRVLIADDSLVGQGLLKGILLEDPRFEIIGIVGNGKQAIDFIAKNKPDVVSMDIFMPVMDGVEATTLIMQHSPVPIAIVSSFYNPAEMKLAFTVLEAGALVILPRPFGPGHPQFSETARNYRNTLKMLSEIRVTALKSRGPIRKAEINSDNKTITIHTTQKEPSGHEVPAVKPEIIVIGASAGGPQAIHSILKNIPKTLRVPVLIVQHIDKNFAEGYCKWLNSMSNLPVCTAANNQELEPGVVYLPPGDYHIGLRKRGVAAITQAPPEHGLRPAVSYLFRDACNIYKNNLIAVLLSGMGTDGAAELKMLRDAGAFTIAQDSHSALVHGMPGEAIRIGAAARILSPEEIVNELIKYC